MLKSFLTKLFGGAEPAAAVEPTQTADLTGFVDYVVRGLVDSPDAVTIDTREDDGGTVITINCSKDEVGKIIGRNGRTIGAIRALVRGAAGRLNQSATVVVAD